MSRNFEREIVEFESAKPESLLELQRLVRDFIEVVDETSYDFRKFKIRVNDFESQTNYFRRIELLEPYEQFLYFKNDNSFKLNKTINEVNFLKFELERFRAWFLRIQDLEKEFSIKFGQLGGHPVKRLSSDPNSLAFKQINLLSGKFDELRGQFADSFKSFYELKTILDDLFVRRTAYFTHPPAPEPKPALLSLITEEDDALKKPESRTKFQQKRKLPPPKESLTKTGSTGAQADSQPPTFLDCFNKYFESLVLLSSSILIFKGNLEDFAQAIVSEVQSIQPQMAEIIKRGLVENTDQFNEEELKTIIFAHMLERRFRENLTTILLFLTRFHQDYAKVQRYRKDNLSKGQVKIHFPKDKNLLTVFDNIDPKLTDDFEVIRERNGRLIEFFNNFQVMLLMFKSSFQTPLLRLIRLTVNAELSRSQELFDGTSITDQTIKELIAYSKGRCVVRPSLPVLLFEPGELERIFDRVRTSEGVDISRVETDLANSAITQLSESELLSLKYCSSHVFDFCLCIGFLFKLRTSLAKLRLIANELEGICQNEFSALNDHQALYLVSPNKYDIVTRFLILRETLEFHLRRDLKTFERFVEKVLRTGNLYKARAAFESKFLSVPSAVPDDVKSALPLSSEPVGLLFKLFGHVRPLMREVKNLFESSLVSKERLDGIHQRIGIGNARDSITPRLSLYFETNRERIKSVFNKRIVGPPVPRAFDDSSGMRAYVDAILDGTLDILWNEMATDTSDTVFPIPEASDVPPLPASGVAELTHDREEVEYDELERPVLIQFGNGNSLNIDLVMLTGDRCEM